MILLKIALPAIYSLFIGGAYGAVFRKRFGHSLMQAYCLQILLLLISGMLFRNLLIGVALGCLLAAAGWAYGFYRDKKKALDVLRPSMENLAVPAFLILVLVIFVMNYGKQYIEGDEFSHWGRFLKESCRINQLYVMSPAQMAHKDYVPAVTLFEYLWCKLSLAYSEANAYRGIQMLLAAVVLAVAEKVQTVGKNTQRLVQYGGAVLTLMGIPLLFSAFRFYHSIYEDAIFGILIFYSVWIVLQDQESVRYRSFSLSLALTVLMMCKMTAVPFAVLIWIFYIWNERRRNRWFSANWKWQLLPFVVSGGLWGIYNWFVKLYVEVGGMQSYGGLTAKLLIGVILHNGTVTWQNDVETSYWKAIVSQGLVGGAPFAFVAAMTIAVLILVYRRTVFFADECRTCNEKGRLNNKGVRSINADTGAECAFLMGRETYRQMLIWLVLSTAAYVLMMCILYDTSFTEYEARQLASYDRYMSSWLIMMVYLTAAILLTVWQRRQNSALSLSIIALLSFVVVSDNRWQLLSGIQHTELDIARYEGECNLINSAVAEDESVLIIERGSNGLMTTKVGYYCLPRVISFLSPGPAVYDGDIWSTDMTPDELKEQMVSYDYVYFIYVDSAFADKYHEILPEIDTGTEGILYRVYDQAGNLELEQVN